MNTTTKNTTESVPLHQIAMDETLQVRKKLDDATVKKYAAAMAAHAEFPPVLLGRIGDGLLLVDGWHRVNAARIAGREEIEAIIITMTHEEAVWAAAGANLRHGLPLKSSELLEVFKAYVRAGEHKTGRRYKSYRQIAEDLQGQVAFNTVRNWMEKHFKKIYLAMGDKARSGNGEATQPPRDLNNHYATLAVQDIDNVSALDNLLTDPGSRHMLIKRLEGVLAEMKKKPHEEADF
jgi:hypothetical protein